MGKNTTFVHKNVIFVLDKYIYIYIMKDRLDGCFFAPFSFVVKPCIKGKK